MAATITVRPFGSTAMYYPGTVHQHPVLPNVYIWTFVNFFSLISYYRILNLPESELTATKSFVVVKSR